MRSTLLRFQRARFSAAADVPAQSHVPSLPMLPVIGSLPWLERIPDGDGRRWSFTAQPLDALLHLGRTHGPLLRMGLPGVGVGVRSEMYLCSDPVEYMQVMRSEGIHPYGAVQLQWAIGDFAQKHMPAAHHLFGRGPDWRRVRLAMQKDILPPDAALAYAPGVIAAAEAAADGAPLCAHEMSDYMNRATFDMFNAVLLGRVCRTADPQSKQRDAQDLAFAHDAAATFENLAKLGTSIAEPLANTLGLPLRMKRQFDTSFLRCMRRAKELSAELLEREARGELTPAEETSYPVRAVRRARAGGTESVAETVEVVSSTLLAAVDTTSTTANWVYVHLARNPEAQAKLHAELRQVLGGGPLTREAVESGALPFLNAVIREAHRLTPGVPMVPLKQVESSVTLCGHELPAGSLVAFTCMPLGHDPSVVEAPAHFRPERFLPPAIEARKGTRAEMLDHALMSSPFSAGARRCPGSRVAGLEIRALLAAFVRKYEIRAPGLPPAPEPLPYAQTALVGPSPMPTFEFKARVA
jgi:cytochrome P450